MSDMSRREFVAVASMAACACLLCRSGFVPAADSTPGPVPVGPLKDFAADGVVGKWAQSNRFLVIRHEGKLYAPSSICTHKNTVQLKVVEKQLVCSRHGSRFTLQGTVARGPAQRPLARYGISVNGEGLVVVNTAQRFEQDKWDDPASFVQVP